MSVFCVCFFSPPSTSSLSIIFFLLLLVVSAVCRWLEAVFVFFSKSWMLSQSWKRWPAITPDIFCRGELFVSLSKMHEILFEAWGRQTWMKLINFFWWILFLTVIGSSNGFSCILFRKLCQNPYLSYIRMWPCLEVGPLQIKPVILSSCWCGEAPNPIWLLFL